MLFRNCRTFVINTTYVFCMVVMDLLENDGRNAVYGYGPTAEIERHEVS